MSMDATLRFAAHTDAVTSLMRIIDLVRTEQAVTRPEIGRITGLGRGVVTQRLEHAVELELLAEGAFGPSSGGRAPRTLRFRSDRGWIVVAALGALHIRVGIADLTGPLAAEAHREWNIAEGPEATIATVIEMADALLADLTDAPVWAVGVGLPGPVDFQSGRPVAPPIMPGWNGFDVREAFEARFDAPVWVDNDVNLLAMSERARRPGGDRPLDLIYCKVGSGIGAGLLSNGRLHRGANGAAGDIGHVRIRGAEQRCRCGKIGCLEAVAGGWALVRDAAAAIDSGRETMLAQDGDDLTLERIARAAERGDGLAIELVQGSARVVGEAIATLVNVCNPAVIVVGGAVAASGEIFLAEVRRQVYELSLPLATRDLVIALSVADPSAPVRGGLEMVREQLFDVTFARWIGDGRPTLERLREERLAA